MEVHPNYYSSLCLLGELDRVGDLNYTLLHPVAGHSVNITWTAPFTLDVTDTEIDIVYCVTIATTSKLTFN